MIYFFSHVSDGRMRQIRSSLPEGHLTSDEQPPNLALTHPSHIPGCHTGYRKHTHTHSATLLNFESYSCGVRQAKGVV